MSIKYYDTCSLLKLQEKVFDEKFVICSKTLEELENIKVSDRKDAEVKFKARKIVRLLDDNIDNKISSKNKINYIILFLS